MTQRIRLFLSQD